MVSRGGVLRQGPLVVMDVAGAANAQVVFNVSDFAQQVGVKSFRLKRVFVRNNGGGNDWLFIGVGVPCVPSMPAVMSINDLDAVWDNLPEVEFFENMTMYPDALPGGGAISVQVEVEEIG